jgi:hypothetical protein
MFWTDPKNQRDFMDSLGKKLNIRKPDDWYNIDVKSVHEHGRRNVVNIAHLDKVAGR